MKKPNAGQDPAAPRPLWVGLYEARPNKMFTEEQRASVRFLRYSELVACSECGRRSKTHWTVLCSFEAQSLGFLVPKRSGKVHRPLDPVCRAHILAMAPWTPPPPPPRKRKPKEQKEEG
jgi:hypothetical protein